MSATPRYTPDQLKNYAQQHGVEISTRQVEEWNKAGFLPAPTREKLPGQGRGRAPYQYPESASDVVLWLGKHRKYIRGADGDDTAAFWLWLSGCDYIQMDPILYLLTSIRLAWDDLHEYLPSLPDIADTAEHGLSKEQVNILLDEWDAAITAPALAAEEVTNATAPSLFLDALMSGIVPPEWTDPTYPEQRDMQPEAAAIFNVAPDDPRVARVAQHIPYLVRAASLTTLYRRLSATYTWAAVHDRLVAHAQDLLPAEIDYLSGQCNRLLADMITPEWLRMWWRFLTPEMIATYWRGSLGKAPRLRSRDELLRHWGYDPLYFLAFAADVSATFQRGMGAAPQSKEVTVY